jgi:hypothetical protein
MKSAGTVAGWIAVTVAGVFVLGAIILGGWAAGWWFKEQNVNREAKVLRQSYGFQKTYSEQVTKGIGDISEITVQITAVSKDQAAALKAQRYAILDRVCETASQVTTLSPDQIQFVATYCVAGNANPNSEYTK